MAPCSALSKKKDEGGCDREVTRVRSGFEMWKETKSSAEMDTRESGKLVNVRNMVNLNCLDKKCVLL